jgi:uncharacterized membrane protein (UPF0127 family)
VRTVTIIAIVAAAAAGIIAGSVLLVIPAISVREIEDEEPEIIVGGVTPSNNGYRQVNITVNDVKLVADVAFTNDQRSKGLSVKDTLNENEGMLFVFSSEREHSFWMKNMKFPIDIIWLDDDQEVVHVEHSLEPCISDSFCPTHKPDRNSLYVLETVAGFAQKYNVTDNTYVDFKLDEQLTPE